jgi:hypothetical protein
MTSSKRDKNVIRIEKSVEFIGSEVRMSHIRMAADAHDITSCLCSAPEEP